MNMDLIEGSETPAIIIQTPGNYPKENLLYSVHGESLKSRRYQKFSESDCTVRFPKNEKVLAVLYHVA